jgi:hypothetical protein
VKYDIDVQSRLANQLLWSMENKLAEESVMMDEIEVLLSLMRDNLTPSLSTSETQASGCFVGFSCLYFSSRVSPSIWTPTGAFREKKWRRRSMKWTGAKGWC